MNKCFGANYAQGDFGGSVCADYLTCSSKCACDKTCQSKCVASADCNTCMMNDVAMCVLASCMTETMSCSGSGTGGTGSTGGASGTGGAAVAGCATLKTCCDSMAAGADKTACDTNYTSSLAAGALSDMACGFAMIPYTSKGLCK